MRFSCHFNNTNFIILSILISKYWTTSEHTYEKIFVTLYIISHISSKILKIGHANTINKYEYISENYRFINICSVWSFWIYVTYYISSEWKTSLIKRCKDIEISMFNRFQRSVFEISSWGNQSKLSQGGVIVTKLRNT